MQPLNAIDAIAPAFTRTHQTLAYPFRLGRAWKLCASNYLAFAGSMFLPYPLFFFIGFKIFPQPALVFVPLLVMLLFSTIFLLLVLYFGGRMELVVFEMLVTRAKFIAPMWRHYQSRVWPWLGWKVLIGTVCGVVIFAAAYSPIRHSMIGMMAIIPTLGAHPDPAAVQSMVRRMIGLESVFYLLFFLLKIPSTLLNDFVLPFFVLEDIPMTEAMRRGLDIFIADPLHVLLYLVLKPILFGIGAIMLEIAVLIAMIPIGIAAVICIFVGSALSGHNNPIASIALVSAMIVLYGVLIWASIGMFGYLVMLFEAYAIYFLGGRYPLLGNLLEPGPGYPFTPPPILPSADERKDKDGGPPMPMNPAVA